MDLLLSHKSQPSITTLSPIPTQLSPILDSPTTIAPWCTTTSARSPSIPVFGRFERKRRCKTRRLVASSGRVWVPLILSNWMQCTLTRRDLHRTSHFAPESGTRTIGPVDIMNLSLEIPNWLCRLRTRILCLHWRSPLAALWRYILKIIFWEIAGTFRRLPALCAGGTALVKSGIIRLALGNAFVLKF